MSKTKLKTYLSHCPNDTFIFGPLVHAQVDSDYEYEVQLEDIEKLNQIALSQQADLIKVSAVLYPQLKDRYHLIESGGAMGMGVGPLLVGREDCQGFSSVALPGAHTTAHFLFDMMYPEFKGTKTELIFSQIPQAILKGEVDAGVLIHEGRFTYHEQGLKLIDDLGERWETETDKPLPLGVILASKSLSIDAVEALNRSIQQSIALSWDAYPELDSFVTLNATEMSVPTMRQHIELYVNKYSLSLGDEGHAALKFLEKNQ